jgi:serine/threonine protein kinase
LEDQTVFQPHPSPGSVRRGVRLNGISEIGSLIAQGGMGEVYRGFNILTNDPVAIKMILPELANDPDTFELFRREASTLYHLQHEAIVRYFVFSVDPELRRAYLAMEYVDGPSLGKRLSKGSLSVGDVGILQRRLAGALDAAHRAGVIHRDISPDNVILPGDDPRRAKIIDFGIARSLQADRTLLGGGFAGKYNYVSPEQLGLAGGEVGPKSDIYSLGLVLAGALRGRPLDMGGSQVEVVEKRRRVPDLSDIDATMRPLIAAMLDPSPAKRPDSMAAVADWLSHKRSGRSPQAREGVETRTGRLAAGAAAFVLIASLAGTAYVFRDNLLRLPAVFGHPSVEKVAEVPATTTTDRSHALESTLPPLGPGAPGNTVSPSPGSTSSADTAPSWAGEGTANPSPSHPPTADELAAALAASKQQRNHSPNVGASESAPPTAPNADLPRNEAVTGQKPPASHATNAEDIVAVVTRDRREEKSSGAAEPSPKRGPLAPQTSLSLGRAFAGETYIAELPPFSDPGDLAGLKLHVEPSPPEGMRFVDFGSGLSQLSGKPATAGDYSFDIVGQDASGATARMSAELTVETPPAAQPPAVTQEVDKTAAAPAPPPKLTTTQSPEPDAPPSHTNAALAKIDPSEVEVKTVIESTVGASAGGSVKSPQEGAVSSSSELGGATPDAGTKSSTVAELPSADPAQAEQPSPKPPSIATAGSDSDRVNLGSLPTNERAARFLQNFDGGPCFLVHAVGADATGPAILGVGADKQIFQRFYQDFQQLVGLEPNLMVRLIGASQCPALGLIGASVAQGSDGPKIELASFNVGRNHPLAGVVSNLGRRTLLLLLITSDGQVRRVETRMRAEGASATFDVPIAGDHADAQVMQILLAIVSFKPIPALAAFKSGRASEILPRVEGELLSAGARSDAEFFRFQD